MIRRPPRSTLFAFRRQRQMCIRDRAWTVLRGGQVTGVCNPAVESNASLSRLMIGSEPPELTHRESQVG
ncbi:hypothetical protein, partial [Delftia sp. ASV31]|uniref:hypothetical protein n=1 Tax=Delftia sp. ASV31 TaxID=2795113 RepID=UPI001E3464C2